MAGVKRFVTYIYSYEEKKKGNNCGFAKIEVRGEDCRVEIHLRGVDSGAGSLKAYLFMVDQGDMIGFGIGEMKVSNGNGDYGTIIKAGSIGDAPHGIYEMEGLCLIGEDERIFMSRWKEGIGLEVSRAHFRTWQPPQLKEQEESRPQDIPAQSEHLENTEVKKKTKEEQEALIEEAEHISATEIPMRNVFPQYDWLSIWNQLQTEHPIFTPFEDKSILCVQIELKNLRELPKRYWYLGNNSFLLHGFFNYRYLIIGNKEKNRWFIGIPGVYQHQERVMAAIFGFPEFIPAAIAGEKLETDEPVNHFGYWYRFIEE